MYVHILNSQQNLLKHTLNFSNFHSQSLSLTIFYLWSKIKCHGILLLLLWTKSKGSTNQTFLYEEKVWRKCEQKSVRSIWRKVTPPSTNGQGTNLLQTERTRNMYTAKLWFQSQLQEKWITMSKWTELFKFQKVLEHSSSKKEQTQEAKSALKLRLMILTDIRFC